MYLQKKREEHEDTRPMGQESTVLCDISIGSYVGLWGRRAEPT